MRQIEAPAMFAFSDLPFRWPRDQKKWRLLRTRMRCLWCEASVFAIHTNTIAVFKCLHSEQFFQKNAFPIETLSVCDRCRVDDRRKRIEKYMFSNENALVCTGSISSPLPQESHEIASRANRFANGSKIFAEWKLNIYSWTTLKLLQKLEMGNYFWSREMSAHNTEDTNANANCYQSDSSDMSSVLRGLQVCSSVDSSNRSTQQS